MEGVERKIELGVDIGVLETYCDACVPAGLHVNCGDGRKIIRKSTIRFYDDFP